MDYQHSEFSIKSEEDEEDMPLIDNDARSMMLGSFNHQNNEQKSQDLFDLLKSWNQLELFDHFSNEKIDLEVLSVIKPHHFERLLEPFNLRNHILFEHNLEQWRHSIGLPLPKYPEMSSSFGPHRHRSYSRSIQYNNTPSQRNSPTIIRPIEDIEPSPSIVPVPETTDIRASLDTIMKSSIKGRMLLDIYETHKKFEETHRIILIQLIAEYYTDKGIHLELPATHKIEQEILSRFPTEQLEYYRTSRRGRIYNKFCNHKYSLMKVARSFLAKADSRTVAEASAEPEPPLNLVPEEDAEEKMLLLKNDNLSKEQFESIWNGCVKFRINEIRRFSLPVILTKWPQYKLHNGYKYIAMDFRFLEPKWNSLINNWDSVSEKLLHFLTAGHSIKTHKIKSVLVNIKNIDSRDCRDAALLWCLHGYLKPTNIISKVDDKGKKILSKISIQDSQDAFIYVAKSLQDIESHKQLLKKQYSKVDPFIAVLGTNIMNFKKIFVCIEDIKYSLDSFINALDLCYNIIVLFKLEFPTACKGVWSFLQNMFFETKIKTQFPRVHILINELRGT